MLIMGPYSSSYPHYLPRISCHQEGMGQLLPLLLSMWPGDLLQAWCLGFIAIAASS